MPFNRTMTKKEMDKLIKDDKVIFPLQRQQPPQNQEPFDLQKYLQQLSQSLANNKDQNATIKGRADQLMADSLSATYSSFMQLLQPIIQDHVKQTELIKSLEKALGDAKKPEKKIPAPEMPAPKTK